MLMPNEVEVAYQPLPGPYSSRLFVLSPTECEDSDLDLVNKLDAPLINHKSSRQSYWLAIAGLCFAILFGLLCIISGVLICFLNFNIYGVMLPPGLLGGIPPSDTIGGAIAIFPDSRHHLIISELVRFALTHLNTLATDAIGYVHAASQRSMLAAATPSPKTFDPRLTGQSALHFNTNLRFFTAPQSSNIGFFHPNGTFFNFIMAILLILSYAAVSLSLLEFSLAGVSYEEWDSICIFAIPVITLGICILLKAAIAIAGLRCTQILTWSSSPLSSTSAVLAAGKIARIPGRCMHDVVDTINAYGSAHARYANVLPKKPSTVQPSAWQAHRSIRRIIVVLWVLVAACGAWGGIVVAAWHSDRRSAFNCCTPGLQSWSFFPTDGSNSFRFGLDGPQGISGLSWLICFSVLLVVQGALTMALHCCELIVNVLRDEHTWRKATSKRGAKPANMLKSFGSYWPSLVLQVAKPLLHWIFGFCLSLQGTILVASLGVNQDSSNDDIPVVQANLLVVMRSVQTWYLMLALAVFSSGITFLAIRKPRGPQPAAYGHIQTLANLIDDWPPDKTMWWGHKDMHCLELNGERVYHAGTAETPLPPVKLTCRYA